MTGSLNSSIPSDFKKNSSSSSGRVAVTPIVAEGIFRLDADEGSRKAAFPSLSFADPSAREQRLGGGGSGNEELSIEDVLAGVAVTVEFSSRNDQQVVTIQLPEGSSFYGTGEVGGPLERSKKRIFTWNTDCWGFNGSTPSLYMSHPWVFALLPDGRCLGFLADTTRRCEVDLRGAPTLRFTASAPFPLILFGPTSSPTHLLELLAKAIGPLPLPARWVLGYQQCRFSYESAARVEEVAKAFREKKIPCDVMWMDIDYMDGYKSFTFDPANFPEPLKLARWLNEAGFKAIWMLDPGIKEEQGYAPLESGDGADVWILNADGKPFVGDVWPGPCKFPDYTMQRAREWWRDLVAEFAREGVDGIWNDMNEPTVFRAVNKTMPDDNIHRGDDDMGGTQNHLHYHNVYGMLMARATSEGLEKALPEKRPFVLTRAGYIGSQRYAASWTGDNLATWEYLHMSVPMALNMALSGQPLNGPDIGGFALNATPRLFARWMGIGALLPFSRGHSEKGTKDAEPWVFGEACESVCRKAIERRYHLLPHLYTLFYHHDKTGRPVISPLAFADPSNPALRAVEDQFLLGPLLVMAFTERSKFADPSAANQRLPPGTWRRFHFHDSDRDLPLLFLKASAILPTGPVAQTTQELSREDPVTLVISLDESGTSEGQLFEDEGDGFGYRNGEYLLTSYAATHGVGEGGQQVVEVKVAREEGSWKRPHRKLVARVLLGDGAYVEAEGWDGDVISVPLPSAAEADRLVAAAVEEEKALVESAPLLLDGAKGDEEDGGAEALAATNMAAGDLQCHVVLKHGGRLDSLFHYPSGQELLESRFEEGGYEEYSESEYRSPGCHEQYHVVSEQRDHSTGGSHRMIVEGDIGSGLTMRRCFSLGQPIPAAWAAATTALSNRQAVLESTQKSPGQEQNVPLIDGLALKDGTTLIDGLSGEILPSTPNQLHVTSAIIASAIGAGSGGFSRLACLRVHPSFRIVHSFSSAAPHVRFTSIKGEEVLVKPDVQELWLRGDDRPNGEWSLVDPGTGRTVVSRFNPSQVHECFIYWGSGFCNLELVSEERPVSVETPLRIDQSYSIETAAE
ncbi:hypothetical protein CLOM_g19456 [Closterium sp. NIES-68]|nr:hypothetical protein CLOM_g19456 [Closterium sp. NIES-68]